jgi:comEA protein
MRLPKWVLFFVVLLAGMAQYSNQVHASVIKNTPSYSGNLVSLMAMTAETSTVNINSANAEQLSSLPGIGLKKAEAIVAYRKLNGEFESVEEIVNVKGIGPKMLAKLDGLITV